ncbi:hypothetical protein [Alteriqipengyuania lutimaris]|uniref:Sel1 repeat family protein n=1 Tax=Alteriqipengyuania lutimaris TaxID=1538146 RepID=A0A395LPJ5_9SPHN|nr:hypothetical protein [Alteriqipengyuania lutimaris]MBB3033505.1 hypothetical protein [Alteriqipengyuania lutimaris]RDS77484.1 hypothetical protein DL238_07610 [Alteriqipengyuania lutimaris]
MRFASRTAPQRKPAIAIAGIAIALSACAAPTAYMGVPFDATANAAMLPQNDLQRLAVAMNLYDLACRNADARSDACIEASNTLRTALLGNRQSLASLPLGQVARLASTGNKQAQLELGVRFEEGRGVSCDPDKARALYRRAAANSGGTIWVYQPPVGNGTSGRTVPLDTGPRETGLSLAAQRLAALERRLEQEPRGTLSGCSLPNPDK